MEWRGAVELIEEQHDRINGYGDRFGAYSILSNNCEMFAWYVLTGKRYSGQTQEILITQVGAALISRGQPVHTVRSQKYLQNERAVLYHLKMNLVDVKQQKLLQAQADRDAFWRDRDAARK